MKGFLFSYLLFVSCLFSVLTAYSQDYYPLPFDEGVWQESYFFSVPNVFSSELNLYYFDGDTSIGTTLYKKVYNEGSWSFSDPFGNTSSNFPKTYFGAMRQDTVAKKVYYFGRDSLSEELLYDFDLAVGDTLKFLCPGTIPNPLCSDVVLVDSIVWVSINNSLRHRFFYHVGADTLSAGSIVEGIGNTHGFIYSSLSPEDMNMTVERNITCVTLNGIQVFGDAPVCFSPGHFTAVITLPDQSVSVNEFQNGDEIIFRLSNPNNKMIHLTITDMLGQVERAFQLNHSQDLSLSRSEFSFGYHLATFTTNNGAMRSIKFVVF